MSTAAREVDQAPGGAGVYVVMTRPPTVPPYFVATPNGWFDPACVVEVGAHERVLADGSVARMDGSISRPAQPCTSPRYDVQGRIIPDRSASEAGHDASTPTTNGWVEYLDSTALGALSYVHAQWNVPAAPSSNTGQVVYFFPGLENASIGDIILQPVLGWNQAYGPAGWSLASWNCCASGTTWHSSYLAASPGTTVSGDMTGTNCAANGVCTNWTILSTNPDGSGVSLQTTVTEAMNWVFGNVLEAYSIDTCSELPASSPVTASAFSFRTAPNGTAVATPTWDQHTLAQSPSCSYSVSATASTASVGWVAASQVCTPGDIRDCCPFSGGCGCIGEQTCNASGTGWGSCLGATRVGTQCP
ncbi:MAG TPA: hypothetical protein VFT22_06070 [Kofleriaceae bacterium]|nr:hypothetical protein [Kofleriaceae bacterium]